MELYSGNFRISLDRYQRPSSEGPSPVNSLFFPFIMPEAVQFVFLHWIASGLHISNTRFFNFLNQLNKGDRKNLTLSAMIQAVSKKQKIRLKN